MLAVNPTTPTGQEGTNPVPVTLGRSFAIAVNATNRVHVNWEPWSAELEESMLDHGFGQSCRLPGYGR
jgi:hypothetical protein